MKLTLKAVSVWLVVAIAVFLRVYALDSLPAVVHRDEASLGYNAYVISQTGADEHGKSWPLNFQAFGEYKLPGLIYLTVPFVSALGLNIWSVRLPTALAAILSLPALYWLAAEMGLSKRTRWLSVLLLGFSFWHISQARNAYEPMVGLLLSLSALASWLRAAKKPWWYGVGVVLYGLSSLTYNVPWLLLPVMFAAFSVINRHQYSARVNNLFWAWMGVVLVGVSIGWMLSGVNSSRSGTTVFNNPELIAQSYELARAGVGGGLPSLLAKGAQYKLVLAMVEIPSGYLASFNPVFLFFTGDGNPWHNLQSIQLGNMNPVVLIWSGLGLWIVLKTIKEKSSQLMLSYMLISPLFSAVTVDAPITNRLLDFHVAIIIIAAVGLDWLVNQAKHARRWKYLLVISAVVFIAFLSLFILRYLFIFNQVLHASWNPQVDKLVDEVSQREQDFDVIYITSDLELGYIFFAFYDAIDPVVFSNQAQRYVSGFNNVSQLGKYRFQTFPTEWQTAPLEHIDDIFYEDVKNILVVKRGKMDGHGPKVLEITDWSGKVQWTLWSISLDQVLTQLQALPPTSERQIEIQYLQSCQRSMCDPSLLPSTDQKKL